MRSTQSSSGWLYFFLMVTLLCAFAAWAESPETIELEYAGDLYEEGEPVKFCIYRLPIEHHQDYYLLHAVKPADQCPESIAISKGGSK